MKLKVYARPSNIHDSDIAFSVFTSEEYFWPTADDRYLFVGELDIGYSMAELKAYVKPAVIKELETKRDDLRAAALKVQEKIDSMLAIEYQS